MKRIISFDTFQKSTNSISNVEQEHVDNNTRDTETKHSEPECFTECQISNNISNSKQPITNQFLEGKCSGINFKPQFLAHKGDRMYHLQFTYILSHLCASNAKLIAAKK